MPKKPVLPDEELRKLLDGGVPVGRIALLCRVPEDAIARQVAALEREQARQEALGEAKLRAATSRRPFPPGDMAEALAVWFAPAPDLGQWARDVFLSEDGPLYNPEHDHLAYATLGFLWTSGECRRQGRPVAGMAEMPSVQGNAWLRGRVEQQLREWFEDVPTFLITLHAPYAAQSNDATFCALVEHELLHCGQARDEFGQPRFNKEGLPVLAMKGHDAEEHVSIVRRYGVGAAAGGVAELVEAARRPPSVAAATIAQACGTCLR